MEIKVLGSGCANCKRLLQLVEMSLSDLKMKADVRYITDMESIANSGIMRTPGLIINQKIVSYGRVPSMEDIKSMIQMHSEG